MVKLELSQIGRKFHQQWIFKNISFSLSSGESLLLKGPNGSGKSTLLRIIAGQLTPSSGSLNLTKEEKKTDPADFFKEISWTGPYLELYPEFTLEELLSFHFQFKPNLSKSIDEVARLMKLETQKEKQLRHFSSGMIARVKAGLAILSDSSLLLLDEPTANLDEENTDWFFDLLTRFQNNRILIFASNTAGEFHKFPSRLDLSQTQ